MRLTNIDKIYIGRNLADILMLKEDKGYNPKRYKTIWGNKTALGLYETIKRIMTEKEFRNRKAGQEY
jgi:hypothetical protein